jgi:AraC-like DNA-binding protein
MDISRIGMYDNYMKPATIAFARMNPELHHSNYFELTDVTSWGPRVIPDYEFILIVSGEFGYEEDGMPPINLQSGDILCIPPGATHTLFLRRRRGGSALISCIHLDFEAGLHGIDGDYLPELEPPRLTATGNDSRLHLLFKGIAEVREGDSPRKNDIANCMARELLMRLADIWQGRAKATRSERANEMGRMITENLAGRVGRQELARRFGLSPERVDCLFKGEFGMTPTQFLHAGRIAKACALLLDEGRSVKETASLLGFSDEAHFSKIFKRYMGMPPSRLMPVRK